MPWEPTNPHDVTVWNIITVQLLNGVAIIAGTFIIHEAKNALTSTVGVMLIAFAVCFAGCVHSQVEGWNLRRGPVGFPGPPSVAHPGPQGPPSFAHLGPQGPPAAAALHDD